MGLTNKQQVFVEEYLQVWNAAEAARRAGYSERTARSIGAENLTKPDIAEEIKARIAEKTMGADEVLCRLSDQARGIPARFFDLVGRSKKPGVNFKALKEAGLMHLVKKISYHKDGGLSSVEFYDAQTALELLGKHHALFVDRVKQEDWRSEALEYIRRGEVDFEALAHEFGTDLATQLFEQAGVPILAGAGAPSDAAAQSAGAGLI